MTPRRVGILGGMGPQATVLLMQRLIAAVPATDDADHIPLIVDQNPQVPSRIRFLIEGAGEDPAPTLAAMARRLEAAGAEALAMPCNTAHHFADAIRAASRLPFLDMVAGTVAQARTLAGGPGPVGILGSPALRRIGVFDRAFAGSGLVPLWPSDEAPMLQAIRTIKATGDTEGPRAALQAASADLLARGARVQLVACTEFSLVPRPVVAGVTALDTLDVLVGLIREFSLKNGTDRGPFAPPTTGE
jgi:aspartate racemase